PTATSCSTSTESPSGRHAPSWNGLASTRHSYGRNKDLVFHVTRHYHPDRVEDRRGRRYVDHGQADPAAFKRYNVRRDTVQAEAAERGAASLATQHATTPPACR